MPRRFQALFYLLAGGLVAGTLDIAYACVFWALRAGVPARRIFQSVAAGLLGRESFAGGAGTAALGLALQFFIALTMAAVYYLAAHRWPLLAQRPRLGGAVYGVLLYAFMNSVVVPLSAAPSGGAKDPLWIALSVAAHVFLVGIPCALFARLALRSRAAA